MNNADMNHLREQVRNAFIRGAIGMVAARANVSEGMLTKWCDDPFSMPTHDEAIKVRDAIGGRSASMVTAPQAPSLLERFDSKLDLLEQMQAGEAPSLCEPVDPTGERVEPRNCPVHGESCTRPNCEDYQTNGSDA